MSFGGAFRVVKGQLQRHHDLVPLFAALGLAGTFSVGIMSYTSLRKADVSWNRWANPDPYGRINWEKPTQKLVMGIPSERQYYKKDEQLIGLRKEIYGSGEYFGKSKH